MTTFATNIQVDHCPKCGSKLARIVSLVNDDALRGLARYQCDICGQVFDLRYVEDATDVATK